MVEVQQRAVGRILSGGQLGGNRSVAVQVELHAERFARLEEHCLLGCGLQVDLAQRRHVIEHPECAAIGGGDEIIVMQICRSRTDIVGIFNCSGCHVVTVVNET